MKAVEVHDLIGVGRLGLMEGGKNGGELTGWTSCLGGSSPGR